MLILWFLSENDWSFTEMNWYNLDIPGLITTGWWETGLPILKHFCSKSNTEGLFGNKRAIITAALKISTIFFGTHSFRYFKNSYDLKTKVELCNAS